MSSRWPGRWARGRPASLAGCLPRWASRETRRAPASRSSQPYAPPLVRLPVLHVDLYRIESPDEMEELGLDEARLDSLLVVEWPERAGERAWPDALVLAITPDPAGGRRLTAAVPPAWESRWPT